MPRENILIADDEDVIRRLLRDLLEEAGYRVLLAKDGKEAVETFFAYNDLSLVILNVMMPFHSGWEVLKEIRKYSKVPVIMLTALGETKDEVYRLETGANDYISKPLNYEVLMARIKDLLRDVESNADDEITQGKITINNSSHKIFVDGNEIDMKNKEYQLMLYMMENSGIVLSRNQMLDNVWGIDYEGGDRTIDTHIKMIRAKMGKYGRYIKTIRGNGYCFEAE